MGKSSQGNKRKEKYFKLNCKRNSFTFYVHIFCSSFTFLKSQKRNIIHEFASWKISWHRIFIISFVRFFKLYGLSSVVSLFLVLAPLLQQCMGFEQHFCTNCSKRFMPWFLFLLLGWILCV